MIDFDMWSPLAAKDREIAALREALERVVMALHHDQHVVFSLGREQWNAPTFAACTSPNCVAARALLLARS